MKSIAIRAIEIGQEPSERSDKIASHGLMDSRTSTQEQHRTEDNVLTRANPTKNSNL